MHDPRLRGALPALGRKIERVVLLDQVYEVLKERILDRAYEPDARLNIDALKRELKVSSTPLREALARLTAEGLVSSTPFVGFAVAPVPSPEYFKQLYAFRLVIEPWAAGETARRRPLEILQELADAVAAMGAASLSRRYRRYRDFSQADGAFHEAIMAGSGNEPASRIFADLRIHLHLSRLYIHHEQDTEAVRAHHLAILDAIRAGNAAEAAERMREHLMISERELLG
ncbi:GntR family transcriptional regulator [Bradyrhizobium sp. 13971]|uniref:GntR family transcriptional regulator n=1 Tax=Bradyrhizobium elkanii TaxID=29448 RepID=UPI0008420123|nr:GntR family transcriptional regulator [Bradyrhizobium elkanii]